MNVEDLKRPSEPQWQLVFRIVMVRCADIAPGIRDDLSLHVVNGNRDAAFHGAFGAEARAEIHNGFKRDTALLEVGMLAVEFVEAEFKGPVRRGWFFLSFRWACRSGVLRFVCELSVQLIFRSRFIASN